MDRKSDSYQRIRIGGDPKDRLHVSWRPDLHGEAMRRFPTGRGVVRRLQQLGTPSTCNAASTYQDEDILYVVYAFEALSIYISFKPCQATINSYYNYHTWSTVLFPWIVFVLQNFVIARSCNPGSLAFPSIRNHAMLFIPGLISCFKLFNGGDKDIDRALSSLIMRAWCHVIAEQHISWTVWCDHLNDRSPVFKGFTDVAEKLDMDEDTLGLAYINHIDTCATNILRRMTGKVLLDFGTFLIYLRGQFFIKNQDPDPTRRLERSYPFKSFRLRGLAVRAFQRLLTRCLARANSPLPDDTELSRADSLPLYRILYLTMGPLNLCIGSRLSVLEALKEGLLLTTFRVCTHDSGSERSDYTEMASEINEHASNILRAVARCLFCPAVLHTFVKAQRAVSKSTSLENRLQTMAPDVYIVWVQVLSKAAELNSFRNSLRTRFPTFSCASDQVRLLDNLVFEWFFLCSSNPSVATR